MKKIILLMSIAIITALSIVGCGNSNGTSEQTYSASEAGSEQWMKDVSVELSNKLFELTNDDAYIALLTYNQSVQDKINEWKDASISKNEDIVVCKIEAASMDNLAKMSGYNMDDLSNVAKEMLKNRFVTSVSSVINSMYGAEVLATTSMLNCGKSYVCEKDVDNQVWFISTTNSNLKVYVSFANSGDNVLTVSSGYVVCDGDISELLMTQCMLSTEKVKW